MSDSWCLTDIDWSVSDNQEASSTLVTLWSVVDASTTGEACTRVLTRRQRVRQRRSNSARHVTVVVWRPWVVASYTVIPRSSTNNVYFRYFLPDQTTEWLILVSLLCCGMQTKKHVVLLADRTNGRVYATVLRPSVVVCDVGSVAKRCVLEQKLLFTAYRKSYVRNRSVPKWMTLTFV